MSDPLASRGDAKTTRERLVTAALDAFDRDGVGGTDTNAIARAAGYAPATFYKHFKDKRSVFLAAYERWAKSEWDAIRELVHEPPGDMPLARAIVFAIASHHLRWRGFRASLRAEVARDVTVKNFWYEGRRKQLAWIEELSPRKKGESLEDDLWLMLAMERVCDAYADGELEAMGAEREKMLARLGDALEARLGSLGPVLKVRTEAGEAIFPGPARRPDEGLPPGNSRRANDAGREKRPLGRREDFEDRP